MKQGLTMFYSYRLPDDREGRYPSVRYERMPLAIIGLH